MIHTCLFCGRFTNCNPQGHACICRFDYLNPVYYCNNGICRERHARRASARAVAVQEVLGAGHYGALQEAPVENRLDAAFEVEAPQYFFVDQAAPLQEELRVPPPEVRVPKQSKLKVKNCHCNKCELL